MRKTCFAVVFILCIAMSLPTVQAKEKDKHANKVNIPDYVMDISKENTYPNPTQDLPQLQPSAMAQELLESTDTTIENPTLIHMLNESHINTSIATLGFNAKIFLGKWPLSYHSQATNTNWQYRQVNQNKKDNRGDQEPKKIYYQQKKEKKVSGGLTADITKGDEVKKMMIMRAADKTGLPLAFQTVIGQGTKKERVYKVPPKKIATLNGYVPAVNEKGKVTYGEVYLTLTGNKMQLDIKNITYQGIGAWIPIQDHLSLKYLTED